MSDIERDNFDFSKQSVNYYESESSKAPKRLGILATVVAITSIAIPLSRAHDANMPRGLYSNPLECTSCDQPQVGPSIKIVPQLKLNDHEFVKPAIVEQTRSLQSA